MCVCVGLIAVAVRYDAPISSPGSGMGGEGSLRGDCVCCVLT